MVSLAGCAHLFDFAGEPNDPVRVAIEFGKQAGLLWFCEFTAGETLELGFGFFSGFLQFAAFHLAFGALQELCQDLKCIHNKRSLSWGTRMAWAYLQKCSENLEPLLIKNSPDGFRKDRRNPASLVPAMGHVF